MHKTLSQKRCTIPALGAIGMLCLLFTHVSARGQESGSAVLPEQQAMASIPALFEKAMAISDAHLRNSHVAILAKGKGMKFEGSLTLDRAYRDGKVAYSYGPNPGRGAQEVYARLANMFLKPASEPAAAYSFLMAHQTISPSSHIMRFTRQETLDGRLAYVFNVAPKQSPLEQPAAFQGQLWIDARTLLPLKKDGTYSSPKSGLSGGTISETYDIQGNIAVPRETKISVEVSKFIGKVKVSTDILYSNFALDPPGTKPAAVLPAMVFAPVVLPAQEVAPPTNDNGSPPVTISEAPPSATSAEK